MTAAALVAMVVLAAAGALPVLALVGARWVAVPLIPLGGAVLAAGAAAGMVAVGGSLVVWFAALAASVGVACTALWIVRPTARPWRRHAVESPPGVRLVRLVRLVAFVAVALAAAWSLTALRTPSVGFDARTIWMLHARWYADGHTTSLAALRNTALFFAHAGYPPLIGGTVAVAWLVTGVDSDRFGVVIVALLNACAVMAAAWVLVDLGRRCARWSANRSEPGDALSTGRGAGIVPSLVGSVAAGLLVLVAFGVAGPFATNGYADMLWATAAVGAVGFGLVLSGRRSDLGAAAVLLAVAGLTKDEGYVTSMVIVALITLRAAVSPRVGASDSSPAGTQGRRWRRVVSTRWRAVVFGVMAVVGLGLWPLLTRLLHGAPNAAAPGRRDGDDVSRLHDSVVSMAAHLHVLLLAAPVAVVGMVVLGRARRTMGLGSDGWVWAALVAGLGVVFVVYVTGPGNIALWLLTSTHRTTIYGALLGWWVVAGWAVIGSAHVVRRRGRPPGISSRSA
ncbi:MAG TPA: hypothetical protein VID75_08565 [Acidimicrobiales bacterium]